MVDYPNEILGLINSLHNPRYGSQDAPHLAPILFDGVLQNTNVTFLATSDDPHDYGSDTWKKGQAGEYGPIAPYSPPTFVPPPPIQDRAGASPNPTIETKAFAQAYLSWCLSQVVPDLTQLGLVDQAIQCLTPDQLLPSGARGRSFAALADGFGLSVEEFASFLRAFDELRFAYGAEFMALSRKLSEGNHAAAKQDFVARMTEALSAFNETSPRKIKPPEIK